MFFIVIQDFIRPFFVEIVFEPRFKDALLGLRQFLTTERPLKMMKNTFHFMLKALFVLQIFTFLSRLFSYVEKRLDKKAMVDFKIYDVTDWYN